MTTVFVIPHDLLNAREGWPIIVADEHGGEALIQFGAHEVPESLAQQRAIQEDLPIFTLTDLDLRELIQGRTVSLLAGRVEVRPYELRVPTAEEFVAIVEAAGERLRAQGIPAGPGVTLKQAHEITRTLPPL